MLNGKRLNGRYRIDRLIGGGGMSNVYLAHDMILDRDVAVKILRYDFSNEQELRRRFQREALSATSLAHPNIVNIFDVGEEDDLQYIVMEYVTGQTLKEYITDHAPVPPDTAVRVMRQLASALAHAHQNQIIHRDVKPQNILMDGEENVKITDFGIAMALSATSYTQTNSVLGTVHYLSPEQARGGMATKKSDIYSLGIVMFELLTGQLPFSGESAVAIALKHLQTETPSVRAIVPDLPQSLENIVLKATAKDSRHRYQTIEEMEEDLATALDEGRRNEPKFVVPADDDATKAMPAIKDPSLYRSADETIAAPAAAETPPVTKPKLDSQPAKTKKKRKKWPWLVGIPAAVLLLGLILALTFPGLFEPPKIEVPDVAGMETAAAIEELESAGFAAGEQREENSEEIEAGRVISTIPEAGKERERETAVQLIVSTGKAKVEFLDYTGNRAEEAVRQLEEQNFRSVEVHEEFSDEREGTILQQNIAEGSEVIPSETDVIFTVSKGKDMRTVEDLSGYGESELNDYARSSGFNIRITGEDNSSEVEAGRVLRQNPAPGRELEAGSDIEVVLSAGPAAVPMKTFIQSITIPYEPAGEEAADGEEPGEPTEQQIQILLRDRNHTFDEPAEEFSITEDVTRRIELEIEEGQTAAYRIMRDGEVFLEETVPYSEAD